MEIKNPEIKAKDLLRIASEDGRNLLMQSQNVNLSFIKEQPESFSENCCLELLQKKNQRMNEIRESLSAINMVSIAEAMVEMGECAAARQSLQYFAGSNVIFKYKGFSRTSI